jgi:hypothetical protein
VAGVFLQSAEMQDFNSQGENSSLLAEKSLQQEKEEGSHWG